MKEIYSQKYVYKRSGIWRKVRQWFLFPAIIKLLNPLPQEKILEIGCERGDVLKMIQERGSDVIGIDINKEMIDLLNNEKIIYMSVEKLDFPSCYFDKIVSSHAIEHVVDLIKAFAEIERVLRPGGRCILIYPLEIFRGSNVLFNAWVILSNPFLAGKIHLHRLWPNKLRRFTKMKIIKKGVLLQLAPSFYTILEKSK